METLSFLYQQNAISFRSSGSGKPVLLLHGFGEDSRVFDALLPHLPAGHQYFLPDLPGSGHSAGHPAVCSCIGAMATAMMALMQSQVASAFTVLGHSMGGYIALAMMEQQPAAINGIGLIHSTAFADSEEKKAIRRKAIDFMQENGAQAFLKTAIPGLFAPAFATNHTAVVNGLIEQGATFTTDALVAYYEAMMARPDRTAVLQQAQVPVLFIVGDEDKAVPMRDVLQQVFLPEQSVVHILQGTGHMGMLEDTQTMAAHITTYLQSLN